MRLFHLPTEYKNINRNRNYEYLNLKESSKRKNYPPPLKNRLEINEHL